jgi:hypothetical protein
MRYQQLLEYINYNNQSFMDRWKKDNFKYKDVIGDNGEHWISWLENHDPSPKKKYVNWMITRYLKGGINNIEDIPARLSSLLVKHNKLGNQRKLAPEHSDINRFKKLSDFSLMMKDNYGDVEVTSNKSLDKETEMNFYKSGDADLEYNTPEWKVVIPKTHAASCYFGRNTEWCTTATDDPQYFDEYSDAGPLYILLQKKTNKRWQFHIESEQFMNENDEAIDFVEFIIANQNLATLFSQVVTINNDTLKFRIDRGISFYDMQGNLHNADGPARITAGGRKHWFLHGKRHRIDGPAITASKPLPPSMMHSAGVYWIKGESYSEEDYNQKISQMKEAGEI